LPGCGKNRVECYFNEVVKNRTRPIIEIENPIPVLVSFFKLLTMAKLLLLIFGVAILNSLKESWAAFLLVVAQAENLLSVGHALPLPFAALVNM
jgi:hypothetical protein